jgi:hypothetical protein
MQNKIVAEQLFNSALNKIESQSIKDWADNNKQVWINEIQRWLDNKADTNIERIATFITLTAIG